ncbi:sigma-70 family RNA polymerase sigma factor [Candidatus Woesearchaeota archaeon]|jgi:RNA polymerase primary sigma factor|nr:sigma-70 family RNA polymerase sigma factor [Candidatus Woesearchaeota archaeon]MBT4336415.1 sigma-70 family RNA polymerase sigma factor [Candidatus Woesearchaeota archaeon]MBT4469930.1 sigma-70 family RNA polymerase sigma factor [Candidatus Woesearchaeota archaeon]MBT6744346.1 sigma-70 family RNA polymerase sigma factor [Candidatus Woesearchaeota archaeon]
MKKEKKEQPEQVSLIDQYLDKVGKTPLFSKKEEVEWGQKVENSYRNLVGALYNHEERIDDEIRSGMSILLEELLITYGEEKRERIVEEGPSCLEINDPYRIISELEDLVSKGNKKTEKVQNQVFKLLYWSEYTHQPEEGEEISNDLPEKLKKGNLNKCREAILSTAERIAEENQDLDIKEEIEAINEYKRELMERNLKLVVSVAKEYQGMGLQMADLIQEGNWGLKEAVDFFDYRKGLKFSTYATRSIKQTISKGIAHYAKTVKIPNQVGLVRRKWRKASEELLQGLEREPNENEIVAQMIENNPDDYDTENTKEIIEKMRALDQVEGELVPLEKHTNLEVRITFKDLIEDNNAFEGEQYSSNRELILETDRVLTTLTQHQEKILRMRHGIARNRADPQNEIESGEDIPHSLEEIGQHFGVSRRAIHYHEKKALKKLRTILKAEKLRTFWD